MCSGCKKERQGKSTSIAKAREYYKKTGIHVAVFDNEGGHHLFMELSLVDESIIVWRSDEDI